MNKYMKLCAFIALCVVVAASAAVAQGIKIDRNLMKNQHLRVDPHEHRHEIEIQRPQTMEERCCGVADMFVESYENGEENEVLMKATANLCFDLTDKQKVELNTLSYEDLVLRTYRGLRLGHFQQSGEFAYQSVPKCGLEPYGPEGSFVPYGD